MAQRPVFEVKEQSPYFQRNMTEFTFFSGFSAVQKQRSSKSLREAYQKEHPGKKVLEISGYSDQPLGVALSAFNLMIEQKNGYSYSVECAFQAGKVFEQGGPYKDLLQKTSREAKKDPRLKNSGNIIGFSCSGIEFPNEPKTYFYDWLYVNALYLHKEYHEELVQYDAFTDIAFNPQRQLNCQAEAAAIFVSLYRQNLLEKVLEKDAFLQYIFQNACHIEKKESYRQESLFRV